MNVAASFFQQSLASGNVELLVDMRRICDENPWCPSSCNGGRNYLSFAVVCRLQLSRGGSG